MRQGSQPRCRAELEQTSHEHATQHDGRVIAEEDRPAKKRRLDGYVNAGRRLSSANDGSHLDHDRVSSKLKLIVDLIRATITPIDQRHVVTDWPERDSIIECGEAPLSILFTRPKDVLELARRKTYEWPFKDVPRCWLRLCEDASLLVAASLVNELIDKLKRPTQICSVDFSKRLSTIIHTLDHGIALSGQPRCGILYQNCLKILQDCCAEEHRTDIPRNWTIEAPAKLPSEYNVERHDVLDFEAFQAHLDGSNGPLVQQDLIDDWPALKNWQCPAYLLNATIQGRRLALVEIGSSYADEGMRQQLLPIRQFIDTYILDPNATEIGYIAQHDLLGHVQDLSNDILMPDLCYTSPPPSPQSLNASTTPRRSMWFGPKGTRSPFHTDPDANIYCQVVGYKYFRLIDRDLSHMMYPRGSDENGMDLSNQSQVFDFSYARRHDIAQIKARYPLFGEADYLEVILAPGECLYIPSRWWHFAESLSTSIGVNFWWT